MKRRSGITTPAQAMRIYARDGWQCKMPECLCPDGRAIDPLLMSSDDPWSPTIDHITQVAMGGSNGPGNKRAAHKKCNEHDARFLNSPKVRQSRRMRGLTYRVGDVFDPAALNALITEKFGS